MEFDQNHHINNNNYKEQNIKPQTPDQTIDPYNKPTSKSTIRTTRNKCSKVSIADRSQITDVTDTTLTSILFKIATNKIEK